MTAAGLGVSVKEIKLCLLGDMGVGKSSLVHRFVYDTYKPTIESTIGAAFLTKSVSLDAVVYKYQIWDTAGQEKYRALAPMYYRGAAAAIIAYDITHESSFQSVKTWIRDLQQYAEPDIVLAVAGNKSDLDDLREVSEREAAEYAELQGAIFIETSAKAATNVPALFFEISKRLGSKPEMLQSARYPSPHGSSPGSTVVLPRRQENPQSASHKARHCCNGGGSSVT